MSISKVLEAAALRVSSVKIAGETVFVKEPTGAQLSDFSSDGDVKERTAGLFLTCIVDEVGVAILTKEEATQLASGSTRVTSKLINAITGTLKEDAKND